MPAIAWFRPMRPSPAFAIAITSHFRICMENLKQHQCRRDFNRPIYALPSAHYEPLRHPRAPGPSLTGFRLVSRTTPWGFPYFVTCLAIEQHGVEKTEDRSLLAISRTVRKERGDQHSLKATGGTSDRDGGIAVRLRTTDNYYLVQLDALTNRVLFSLVTHSVPEDRRRRCGYSFAHLV